MRANLAIVAVVACFVGTVAFNASERTERFKRDVTLNGHSVVTKTTVGALGLAGKTEIVGYYGGGKPKVVAFGCEGRAAEAVLIATEESALPRCKRVEPVL